MICSLVSTHFDVPQLDYWSRDMLNFDFLETSSRIVSTPHFVYDFSRKMFLTLYSINWPNFIDWLPLLLEILGNTSNIILLEILGNMICVLELFIFQIVTLKSFEFDTTSFAENIKVFTTNPRKNSQGIQEWPSKICGRQPFKKFN